MTCTVCQRDSERMNSRVAECSHVDCPHRERAWSQGTPKEQVLVRQQSVWDDPTLYDDFIKD